MDAVRDFPASPAESIIFSPSSSVPSDLVVHVASTHISNCMRCSGRTNISILTITPNKPALTPVSISPVFGSWCFRFLLHSFVSYRNVSQHTHTLTEPLVAGHSIHLPRYHSSPASSLSQVLRKQNHLRLPSCSLHLALLLP